MTAQLIDPKVLIDLNEQSDGAFFDRYTMRYFRSRIADVYQTDNGYTVIMSNREKWIPISTRWYVIEHFSSEGRVIGRPTESYPTLRAARKAFAHEAKA